MFAVIVTLLPVLSRIPGIAFVGQVLAVGTGFALAFYLVHLRFLGWLVYVGVRTLNIYLVHLFVIAILVPGIPPVPALNDLPGRGLLLTSAVTAAVVLLSILLTRYLTRVSWLFVYPFGRRKRVEAASGGSPRSAEG